MAAIDLCGTSEVYAWLQKPASDTSGTQITADLITRASRLIHNWTGREFVPGAFGTMPGTAVQTQTFWYRGGGWLTFAPFDLRSAGTVRIDTETTSPQTLTANSDYYLEPLPSPLGVYEAFRFSPGLEACVQPRQVEITGTWGFPSVPEDVKQACITTVGTWLRRDVHAFAATFNVDEARLERPEAIPSAVRSGLAIYRRAGVA